MEIEQFYDDGLAHASYAIISNGEIALVDPARDPQPYYDYAQRKQAKIVAVIETHPHADFVSSHYEIHKTTGATIYASKLVQAAYPHRTFDEGDRILLGEVHLRAFNTPGHSPDSICVVAEDETGHASAIFTGDTLFVGDVGRPDLREKAGMLTAKREELAIQMYRSTRDFIMKLEKDMQVFPAHGAGSLCGKNLSPDRSSSIGRELESNQALQQMSEQEFVDALLEDQPPIPKYFGYNVDINKTGADNYLENMAKVPVPDHQPALMPGALIIDARPQEIFKAGHFFKAINLMNGLKFETWLGSIVGPEEKFYLVAEERPFLQTLIEKTAKIGYETNIIAAFIPDQPMLAQSRPLNLSSFTSNTEAYTIVDIRNEAEVKEKRFFKHALTIPLHELRERVGEIPKQKPVVVHCAGGYRSAAGASIIEGFLPELPVYDLSEAISKFQPL